MDSVKVTFFMVVTDFDAVMANNTIRAFTKLRELPFELIVYSNNVSETHRNQYFPIWKSYPFVQLVEDKRKESDISDKKLFLEGPYEHCGSIWNRELRRITTPYIAMVDADFEIINERFVYAMLDKLDKKPNLIAVSSDYSPTIERHFDSYSGKTMRLNQSWHTWFLIYKKKAFECPVSLGMHREQMPGSDIFDFWDTTGWFQKALQDQYGFELEALDAHYSNDFIHYGAFSKNTRVNDKNINLYRIARILRKRGFFGNRDLPGHLLGFLLDVILFHNQGRGKFLPGYKGEWPDGVDTYP